MTHAVVGLLHISKCDFLGTIFNVAFVTRVADSCFNEKYVIRLHCNSTTEQMSSSEKNFFLWFTLHSSTQQIRIN